MYVYMYIYTIMISHSSAIPPAVANCGQDTAGEDAEGVPGWRPGWLGASAGFAPHGYPPVMIGKP